MSNAIIIKLKQMLPGKLYVFFRNLYRVFFVNPKYFLGPIGFLQKTKLDLYEFVNKDKFIIKYGDSKFFSPGWEILLEKNGYERLSNLNNVLDLGAFIGDSSIQLAQINRLVYAFEPESTKFKWLLKNVSLNNLNKKIKPFNYAVVNSKKTSMDIIKEGDFCGASSEYVDFKLTEKEEVSCMNIKDVMKLTDFDGFKCDIEGGEFPIIKYLLENQKEFKFKKGVIELHFFKGQTNQKELLKNFLSFLGSHNYEFFFYPQNNPTQILNTEQELDKIFNNPNLKYPYVNMFYFYKKQMPNMPNPSHS
jgi:FkbM family methyltransferase